MNNFPNIFIRTEMDTDKTKGKDPDKNNEINPDIAIHVHKVWKAEEQEQN